jgi:HEAT repeat protein
MSGTIAVDICSLSGGRLLEIELDSASTFGNVKHMLETSLQVPASCQELLLGASILQDADTLAMLCPNTGNNESTSLTMIVSVEAAVARVRYGDKTEKLRGLDDICQLGRTGGVGAINALILFLGDHEPKVASRALECLKVLGQQTADDTSSMNAVCELLSSKKRYMRAAGVETLSGLNFTLLNDVVTQTVISGLCGLIESGSLPSDKNIMLKAIRALQHVCQEVGQDNATSIDTVCRQTSAEDGDIRLYAVIALAFLANRGNAQVLSTLIRSLQDEDDVVRDAAVKSLKYVAQRGDEESLNLIVSCAHHGCAAILALRHVAERGDERVLTLLTLHLEDADPDVRRAALKALAKVAERADVQRAEMVTRCLKDPDADVRCAAVGTLASIAPQGNSIVIAGLKLCLCDWRWPVRRDAISCLASLMEAGDTSVWRAIANCTKDDEMLVRQAAQEALSSLGGLAPLSASFSHQEWSGNQFTKEQGPDLDSTSSIVPSCRLLPCQVQ